MNSSQPVPSEAGARKERRAVTRSVFLRLYADPSLGLSSGTAPRGPTAPEPLPPHPLARTVTELLDQHPDTDVVVWAESEADKALHARDILTKMDQWIDASLARTLQAADQVLINGASMLASVSTTSDQAWTELGLACTHALRDHLQTWQRLRDVALNEPTYEAWHEIRRQSMALHQAINHMAGMLHQSGIAAAPLLSGNTVMQVAAGCVGPLIERGLMPADFVTDVAKATREIRMRVHEFAEHGREPQWQTMTTVLGDPLAFHRHLIPTARGDVLRRFVFPVRPGEGTRTSSGSLEKPKPGVHFKRHGDAQPAFRLAAHCGEVARLLNAQRRTWPLEEPGHAALLEALSGHLNELGTGLQSAGLLLWALYARAESDASRPEHLLLVDLMMRSGPIDANPQGLLEAVDQNAEVVIDAQVLKGLSKRPDQHGIRLGERALFDSTRFCLACGRTATQRNLCHLHAPLDNPTQRGVRAAAPKFHRYTEVIKAQRERTFRARLADLLPDLTVPPGQSAVRIPVSKVLYRPLLQLAQRWQAQMSESHPVQVTSAQALMQLQALVEMLGGRIADSSGWPIDPTELPILQALIEFRGQGVSAESGRRWAATTSALIQWGELRELVGGLCQMMVIDDDLATQYRLDTSVAVQALQDFFKAYALELLLELTAAAMQRRQPQVHESLRQHFLSLWFQGGCWWPLPSRNPVTASERDGNREGMDFDNITRLAGQIERWAIWVSLQDEATTRKRYRVDALEDILALKSQGKPTKEIAAAVGMSYDAVRLALMRHERRQAELAAGKKPRPPGRPTKDAALAQAEGESVARTPSKA